MAPSIGIGINIARGGRGSGAARYYVSNSGSDDSNGTEAAPFQTIAKINSMELNGGDIVYFKRGDQWREQLNVPSSGIEGQPITIDAYGTGDKPIINGANITTGWTEDSSNVWVADCVARNDVYGITSSYTVVVDNVLFKEQSTLAAVNAANEFFVNKTTNKVYVYYEADPDTVVVEVSARWAAIRIIDKKYVTIKNIDCRNAGHSGIHGYNTALSGGGVATYHIIDGCNAYRNRVVGIQFFNGPSNNIVQNCTSSYNGNNYYSAKSNGQNPCDNNTFKNNYSGYSIKNLEANSLITDGHGYGCYDCNGCIFEHNESDNDSSGLICVTTSGADDYMCRYNYIHDTTEAAIMLGANSVAGVKHWAYGNLIVNKKATADTYLITPNVTNVNAGVYIYNNTVYQAQGTSNVIMYSQDGRGLNIKNNIFYLGMTGGCIFIYTNANAATVQDNNIYYAPSTWGYHKIGATSYYLDHGLTGTIVEWRAATGLDINSDVINPELVNVANDWSLQSDSPCINAGVDVGLTQDRLGNPIVGLPDLGCHEYQG